MRINEELFPVRATAWKGLLDRAKINGTALPKLPRNELVGVLNACLHLFQSEALLLIRDEKVSAVHSGDEVDYSILPIDELLEGLQENLDKRFPGNEFECGYSDHATNMPSAVWFGDKTNGTYQIKDSIRYAYDKMGNIEKVYENGELAICYQYDALNRLVREDNKTLDKTYVFIIS